MSLLDEARTGGALPGPNCALRKALAQHPDHAADIAEIVRDRSISAVHAARTFLRHGIDLSRHTIERHRKGDCKNCHTDGMVW